MKYVRAEAVEKLLNLVDGAMAHIYDEPIIITHETKEEAYEHGVFSGTRDGQYMAYNSVRYRLRELLASACSFGTAAARCGRREIGEWVENDEDEEDDDTYCSVCGKPAIYADDELLTPCCPWCGAIMQNAEMDSQ